MTSKQRQEAHEIYLEHLSDEDLRKLGRCFRVLAWVRLHYADLFDYAIHYLAGNLEMEAEADDYDQPEIWQCGGWGNA